MNRYTLPTPVAPIAGVDTLFARVGRALGVTLDVLFSLRHAMHQRPAMQRLLRLANQCEASDPVRSAALRREASQLLA